MLRGDHLIWFALIPLTLDSPRSDFMESEMEHGFFAGSTGEGQDMYPRASH